MVLRCIVLAACFLVAGCHSAHGSKAGAPATQAVTEVSPHAQAIAVIAQQRADRIRSLDGADWWTDTTEREWVVRRTASPGIFDTTHDFDVEYYWRAISRRAGS
jgi:hypothetical protein